MKTSYIPLDSAISDIIEDIDISSEDIDPNLYSKWGETVVKYISTDEQLIPKIDIIDIVNFKGKEPSDLVQICEVAYRLEVPKNCGNKTEKIVQWKQQVDRDCELEINLICNKCNKVECKGCGDNEVTVNVDRIWEMANAHHNYNMDWARVVQFGKGTNTPDNGFKILRYANSDWFGLNRHVKECYNLSCENCEHTYMFNAPNIETSFEKGELIISYLSRPTDSEGTLLVPDNELVFEAIADHIMYKILRRDYMKTKNQLDYRAYKDAEMVRDISIGRARSALQLPSFQAWSRWLQNNRWYKVNNALENLYENGRGYNRKVTRKNLYKN